MLKQTEHQLQTVIIEYLERKGYYVMRLNSGMVPNGKGGMIRLAKKGTPDLMVFKEGECDPAELGVSEKSVSLFFIEVKLPKKDPTIAQRDMMIELERYGAVCIVAHSLEEVMML